MNWLCDIVGVSQMKELTVEQVIHLKGHFGKQPIVLIILRCVH